MNNFFLNQDPLLQPNLQQTQPYVQQVMPAPRDVTGELQDAMSNLDESMLARLNDSEEWRQLSSDFNATVQTEMMNIIKSRLNTCPAVVSNIQRQIDIINKTRDELRTEQQRDLAELNDYIKNYSSLSFDEYRQLKDEDRRAQSKNGKVSK